MVRVMVVEDEPPILRSICAKIEEINPRFQVVRTAENGREAVDILAAGADIDVIFVDINLPVLNGIKVLDYIQEQQLDIIPVVLSGYKDFEYVKAAFANNVLDYLLKPLAAAQLAAILERIEEKLEQKEFADNTKTLEHAIRGEHVPVSAGDSEKGYYIVLATLGTYQSSPFLSDTDFHGIFAEMNLPGCFKRHIPGGFYWMVDGRSEGEKVLFLTDGEGVNMGVFSKLFQEVQRPDVPVTLTISRKAAGLGELYPIYHKMRVFTQDNMIFCRGSMLIYNGDQMARMEMDRREEIKDAVLRCRQNPSVQTIYEELYRLLAEAIKRPVKYKTALARIRFFFSELFFQVPARKKYYEIEDDMNFILQNYYDIGKMEAEFKFLIDSCFGNAAGSGKDKQQLAGEIKEYLDENFHRGVTNTQISEKFGLVPSYLSSIFKEYYQVSLGDYVIKKRIEEAKRLLSHPGMMVKDVAEYVGYSDPLYFSKAFKKVTGISPREYVKHCGEHPDE